MVKNNTEISHHVRFQKTPRRSTSIEMDIMNEDNNQPNTELNAYSRPRPPKFKHQDSLKISTNSYLKDGLTITYDLHSDVKENDDSIKHSSARSSRSFNGYEQINQYEIR